MLLDNLLYLIAKSVDTDKVVIDLDYINIINKVICDNRNYGDDFKIDINDLSWFTEGFIKIKKGYLIFFNIKDYLGYINYFHYESNLEVNRYIEIKDTIINEWNKLSSERINLILNNISTYCKIQCISSCSEDCSLYKYSKISNFLLKDFYFL